MYLFIFVKGKIRNLDKFKYKSSKFWEIYHIFPLAFSLYFVKLLYPGSFNVFCYHFFSTHNGSQNKMYVQNRGEYL